LIGAGLVASCSNTTASYTGPSEPARALGIDSFATVESDDHVRIEGVRADGELRAELDLVIGEITFLADPDRFGERVSGRRMTVRVLGETTIHESEGSQQLLLPIRQRQPTIQAFLLDPHVTAMLARHGIEFDATIADVDLAGVGEVGYTCGDDYYPSTTSLVRGSGYLGCAGDSAVFTLSGSSYDWEYRCCTTSPMGKVAAQRSCGGGSSSQCGVNGPNGCAPCWSNPWSTSCTIYIDGNPFADTGEVPTLEWCGSGGGQMGGECGETGTGCQYDELTEDPECCSGWCEFGQCT
jgi:hypothetical protein